MILVTGGAGYIGRHVARILHGKVMAIDDLRNSSREALGGIPLIQSSLAAAQVNWPDVEAVIHCAGSIDVSESVRDPGLYWLNNVAEAASFFRNAHGKSVVFSSTAAVYGEPEHIPICEDHPKIPTSPYGRTKLVAEEMLRDLGMRVSVLRYFNAAGGDEDHHPETHLIPRIVRAALLDEPVSVYGDGSIVRDFVHVQDLARAHLLAMQKPGTYNLGTGKGYTILEVIQTARKVTGKKLDIQWEPPRAGDPSALVADISRARRHLGWEPTLNLEEIIYSAYEWRKTHLNGYRSKHI